METTCRLFKLRSGEEVLGLLSGENDSTISILKPMVIKSHMTHDNFGVTREITVLRNWLEFTEAQEVDIPKDHIATILKPSDSTVNLYQNSIRKEEKTKKAVEEAQKEIDDILGDEDGEILIPEMELMTDKEKDKLKRKGINLEDFPDDPRKYIDDISEDTKE